MIAIVAYFAVMIHLALFDNPTPVHQRRPEFDSRYRKARRVQ